MSNSNGSPVDELAVKPRIPLGVIHARIDRGADPPPTYVEAAAYRRIAANAENRTDRTHIDQMKRFEKRAWSKTMEEPATEKQPPKTEAELIATVANIQDSERSLLFAQRAIKAGMPALAAACEERAKVLAPIKPPRVKKPAPVKAAKVNPGQRRAAK